MISATFLPSARSLGIRQQVPSFLDAGLRCDHVVEAPRQSLDCLIQFFGSIVQSISGSLKIFLCQAQLPNPFESILPYVIGRGNWENPLSWKLRPQHRTPAGPLRADGSVRADGDAASGGLRAWRHYDGANVSRPVQSQRECRT